MCDSEEEFVPVLACYPVLIGKGMIQKFLFWIATFLNLIIG